MVKAGRMKESTARTCRKSRGVDQPVQPDDSRKGGPESV